MAITVSETATTDARTGAITPRNLIVQAGDYRCEVFLTAATEGATRFVASAPGESGRQCDGITSALQLLTDQSGYPLVRDEIEAILVRGRPLLARVVGDLADADRSALRVLEHDGTVRIFSPMDAPPRGGTRLTEWVRQCAEQFDRGATDLLIVALLPGNLPVWAALLLTSIQASSLDAERHLIVIASNPKITAELLPGATVLERDGASHHALTGHLSSIRATRLLPDLPELAHPLSYTSAIAAGLSFARQNAEETVAYLDISEGSTLAIAHPLGVELLHDAACDLAAGAVTLLQRLGTEEVARWIPFPIEATALRTWAVRRVAAPSAFLIDPVDRAIAGGFARAALRAMIATANAATLATRCIVGQGLLRLGTATEAVHTVADILPASRAIAVEADADDLLPLVGYFASHVADSARDLLAHDTLALLGTLLTVPSHGANRVEAVQTSNNPATRTTIAQENVLPVTFPSAGTIRLIWHGGREEAVTIRGGPSGLLVDTRARPLRGIAVRSDARAKVSSRLRASLAVEEAQHE